MSSMLSKNQIKYRDIQGYVISYDRNTVETAEVWAKEHSTGFEPGMMVFCLEKVTPQSAMVVGRKDEGDSYKVSDLCFVVGEDDNRALGVNITSNVYDLRFIEVLLCEKAQKAILNEKDFLYVTCRTATTLDQAKIHEIEQVGAVYAMGGSRRALVVDTNGPNEPAMALLSLMGANITPTGIGRQLLDIGNVCSLLFSSDSRQQDDQNKMLIRSIYMPIPSGQASQASAEIPAAQQQKPQPASGWQGPSGSVGDAIAPPAPTFSQGAESSTPFSGAPQTWGVPSKFEEAKSAAPPPQMPPDFAKSSTAGNFLAPAKSPFQEIPQAPPMDFGGQFAQPANAAPQNAAPISAPSETPDFSTPTEFEQHFNSQPYFEEQPQAAQASEQELRQAYEQQARASQAQVDSPWLPQDTVEPAQAADAPVVIPPRFPTSMYGSSTAAAISPQVPTEPTPQFALNSQPEQFQAPEPAGFAQDVQAPTQPLPPDALSQPEVAETSSGDNMALPSLEELGIQPPAQPELAPPAPSDPSSQWWSAEEMQKPLQESTAATASESQPSEAVSERYIDESQASPVQLAWGIAPEAAAVEEPAYEPQPAEAAPTPFVETPAVETPAVETPAVESAESFMHAQPIEPGNIAPSQELVDVQEIPEPTHVAVEEVKNDPASLWMVESDHEITAPETAVAEVQVVEAPASVESVATELTEPEPIVAEPATSTFFEQAAHAIKPESSPSPFANVQKQGSQAGQSSATANYDDATPSAMESGAYSSDAEIPTSEDTLILSAVKDSQIQSSKPKAKPQVVQDPKLVAKETALLMSKLEHQVAEAGKRLNARSEAVKQRLNKQVEELLQKANDAEKNSQVQTSEAAGRLKTHSHNLSEEIRQQLGEAASGGRYTIKQLLSSNQGELEAKKVALQSELKSVCEKFREDAETFAKDAQKKLQELVDQKTTEIEVLTDGVLDHLEDTNADFVSTFDNRFNRFKDRISDEATSVKQSLERNVRSMFEEVEGSWERASDKLKDNQRDFEQRISHSVKSAKLISSENSKQIVATSIYPMVKERRLQLQKLIDELTKRFQHDSSKQAEAQLNGLEASLTEARHQLQNLVSDCLESINSVGKQQQAGLEDVFKDTSVQAETSTAQIKTQLSEAHRQITETESVCRSLVESSNLDTEVELTEVRNSTALSIKTAKQDANTKLQEAIEEHSNSLDRLSNRVQTDINAERIKQTKAAREASEAGLSRLREAIQEAVAAVQAAREKHME